MTHLAAALFFALVLIGAGSLIQLTVRDHWDEIIAALRSGTPARGEHLSHNLSPVRMRPATAQAA